MGIEGAAINGLVQRLLRGNASQSNTYSRLLHFHPNTLVYLINLFVCLFIYLLIYLFIYLLGK